jgi:hypothetical protein
MVFARRVDLLDDERLVRDAKFHRVERYLLPYSKLVSQFVNRAEFLRINGMTTTTPRTYVPPRGWMSFL